jgi:hypothetical protein
MLHEMKSLRQIRSDLIYHGAGRRPLPVEAKRGLTVHRLGCGARPVSANLATS